LPKTSHASSWHCICGVSFTLQLLQLLQNHHHQKQSFMSNYMHGKACSPPGCPPRRLLIIVNWSVILVRLRQAQHLHFLSYAAIYRMSREPISVNCAWIGLTKLVAIATSLAGVNKKLEFRGDLWLQKTRVHGLSCGVVCVILCLAVLLELRLVTNRHRQTRRDRHIPWLVPRMHSIAR